MKHYFLYLILVGVLVFCPMSCDDGFEALNENPLFPTEAQTGPIFNSIIESLRLGWNRQLFLHNEKLYDVTELAVVTAETFGNVESGAEDVWSNYYQALLSAREIERRMDFNDDPEIMDVIGAQLSIIMAYKTFQITDLFGSIPYSEAGRAYDEVSVLRPKYDDHESIYRSLINDLQVAIDFLQNGGDETSSGNNYLRLGAFDTFFGDDRFKWVTFGNSLLLKHLVRIYDKDPDYVGPLVEGMITSGASFLSQGGDVLMSPREQNWLNQGVNWSFREHNKVRLGSNMWSVMSDNQDILDPRMRILFEPNNDGEWQAFPQISSSDTPQSGGEPYSNARDGNYENKGVGNIYGSVNYYLIRDELDIPEIIMTAAEVKFLLAEVFAKGIGVQADFANASFNYQLGMWESLQFWQNLMINSEIWVNKPDIISSGDLFAVTDLPKYSFNNANSLEEQLTLIYTQRWIDSFRQPWEAFSLIRQTNLIPREKESNQFYRFKYPPSEAIHNEEAYSEQITAMGGDENHVKLWWME